MKTTLRVVEDPDIDDAGRAAAAGALLHVLSCANAIPGLRGLLAYFDDVLVLRWVLADLLQRCPEAMASHQAQSPELFGTLLQDVAESRSILGAASPLVDRAVASLANLTHKGHNAARCIADEEASTWLYDEVHEALVESLEFEDDEVARAVKGLPALLESLQGQAAVRP
ncbi:MAG: hypothetical protein ACPGUV_04755 [Polyangiales bacterium]